jgi:two-component system nitrogen regulation sensor histidine kinase NtrY
VQALPALLRNVVEASGVQGTVHLSATISTRRIVFHVTDAGPGVDPSHHASIFTPFFTTKPQGTGIGFAAARQIAQSHDGDVTLLGGSPTTFDLAVPQ